MKKKYLVLLLIIIIIVLITVLLITKNSKSTNYIKEGDYIEMTDKKQDDFQINLVYHSPKNRSIHYHAYIPNNIEENKNELSKIIGEDNVSCLCSKDNLFDYLDNNKFVDFINKFHNYSKKWIRVRQTNDKTTIAIKHILAPNGTGIQQMLETEIEVPSIKEANNILEALGYAYKSYQEKERITYVLDGYELDIDTWPKIPTYVEVEGKSETDLDNILKNRLFIRRYSFMYCR